MESQHCIVLCTCPDQASAESLARTLVSEELAACVNVVEGIRSFYMWKGRMETGQEQLLLIKTRRDRYEALEQRILTLHPYELPEIVAVPIEAGLLGYLEWIDSATGGGA